MKIQILFGSETGTAQSICEDIYRYVLCNYEVGCCVAPFDLYDVKSLVSESLLICVCSTTGDGDPPRNVQRFWRFIFRRDLPTNALQNLNIAFLGLGDSSYSKFNFASKKLYRRLMGLGAVSLLGQLHLADEQDEFGIEQETSSFLTELWSRLDSLGVTKRVEPISLSPYFECSCEPGETLINGMEAAQKLLALSAEPHTVACLRCVRNDRVTADSHFQDTRLLVLEDTDSKAHLQWLPGDTLNVAPRNDDEAIIRFTRLTFPDFADSLQTPQEVLTFARRMRVTLRRRDTQDGDGVKSHVLWDKLLSALPQSGVSLYFLASVAFDLNRIPVQRFFNQFRQLVIASMPTTRVQIDVERRQTELERLAELGSLRFANDYLDYVTRPRRTVLETLEDFPESIRTLSFEQYFELIPTIRARPYSISNDFDTHGAHLQVLYSIVRYRTRIARVRTGLCSNFLSSQVSSTNQTASVQEGVFGWVERNPAWPSGNSALLNDPRSACVMVACGTGVAPFRALVDARLRRGIGNNLLVFGCRNDSDNYLDRCGDLARWQLHESTVEEEEGTRPLVRVLYAFSRQQDGSKVYVQHKLVEHDKLVWSHIGDAASPQAVSVSYIFLCGGAKTLPEQVRDAFISVCQQAGGLTQQQANQHLATMERERRYVVEVWS